nr:hypothetical protein [Rhabdothermincola salaria]
MVLLVGPGVVRAGQAPAVAEAARRTGAGVVATPGAVGVLPLDDPAWLGVVGLQADDAVRSGLADAELVVTAGIDPAEAPPLADTVQVLEVEPWHLALMARHWPEVAERAPGGSDLTRVLASLVDHASDAAGGLVATSAETLGLLPVGGVVAADAGPAGLWLARGLFPGAATVVVPARPCDGFAAATAFVAALDDRPALAVTAAPVTDLTRAVVDLAAERDLPLVVEVWGGAPAGGDGRLVDRLEEAARSGGRSCAAVPVDLSGSEVLVEALGPVSAWREHGG